MYEFVEELKSTEAKLLAEIADLTEEQSQFKISPIVWSVHECMEHIVVTEVGVYRILSKENSGATHVADHDEIAGREKIARHMFDRSLKIQASDMVKPIGRFSNLDELRNKFQSNRQRICDALQNNQIVFDNHIFIHPVLGELTKKDWLNFMIHHTERHQHQIEDIKADVSFNMYAKSF